MTAHQSGGCLCGGIRFTAIPVEDSAYYCHCRDCQIGSASAYTVAAFCLEQNFNLLQGELKTYSKLADSGRRVNRCFCSDCGTVISWSGEGFPGFVLISVSSLDDPEACQPVHEGWTDAAVSWHRIHEDVLSFPGRPDRDFCA
ncbi:MAG: GFA family protein [Pseudomonadales bacterium]